MTVQTNSNFAWSFSALNQYRNCPRQYYHLKVLKDFKEMESEANTWGKRVHAAMADAVLKGTPLPEGMEQWDKWVKYARQDLEPTSTLEVERKLAVTRDMKPCEFFDRRVEPWLRAVLDVLETDDDYARIIDWKTGQRMDVDSNQLAISAALVFVYFPKVQLIKAEYVWMAQDAIKSEMIERAELREKWATIAPQVSRMMASLRDHYWPAQPTGLCVRHCPVTTCEFHGKGSR